MELREKCEVKGEDCEVFTRCWTITFNGKRVNACPTCADAHELDEDDRYGGSIIVITAQGDPVCAN